MDVDETFIVMLITMLITKLSNYSSHSSSRYAGTNSSLDDFKKDLVNFQSVLADAGRKKISEMSVKDWLHNVKDSGHHIDDLLDRLALYQESIFATTSSRSNSKVLNIIPTACTSYIKRLKEHVDKMKELGLMVVRSDRTSRPPVKFPRWDRSTIVGREKDKEALLNELLGDEACKQRVDVVSIVGMGGIGKTTLAKTLYHDKKVAQHFDIRAWVSLSVMGKFNVFGISQAVFQAVGAQHVQHSADLNLLQASLKEIFLKKRFLLVIDNVWNVDNTEWELFQGPFAQAELGSKFIVTTRNVRVASVTKSVVTHCLEVLSNEEALSLFAQNALGPQNFDSHPTLKLHGEGIVKKCDGLPLALVSIGKMLHTKRCDKEWNESETAKEWKESLNHWILNLGNEILPTLKLSYNGLPPHLKQMFAYCSLFPKDHVFDKTELVLMWMALGFLYYSNTNKSPECLGLECFEELESKYFFQIKKSSGYIMNHMINDLATSVREEYFYRLDDQMDKKEDLEKDKKEDLEKVHHFSFTRQRFGVYKTFEALQKVRCLQTFLAVSVSLEGKKNLFLLNNVLVNLLPQLQFLRVLSLTNYSITELPHSVGSLKHMRYLNCSQTNITYLPDQVADLYNLQSLLLRGCRKLVRLPHSFAKLEQLRHFDISDTPMLKQIPLGIEKLKNLQTLSKVIIEETNGFKISDLHSLDNLQGHLSIEGLQNVTQAEGANLQQMKGLKVLELEWSDVGEPRIETTDQYAVKKKIPNQYDVLEGLRPHDKLRNLKILFYPGEQFPSWIGDPLFVQLTEITLSGCRSCTDLPKLGRLGSLQKLYVESMDKVNTIRFDLPGPTNSSHVNAFPSLKVLEFRDMHGWEKWSIDGGDKDGTTTLFPSLCEIYVSYCPNLAEVSFGSAFPSLEILEFKNMQGWKTWSGTSASFPRLRQISLVNCLNLVVSIESMPSLHRLHIQKCSIAVLSHMVGLSSSIVSLMVENIKELTHLPKEVLKHLREVENLCIKWCDQMTCLWDSETEADDFPVRLQKVEVLFCKKLVSLSKKGLNMDSSMKSVKEVNIRDCERLKNYYCPKSIETLVIRNCSSLTSLTFPTVETSSTLKFLDIQRCDNLEEEWLLSNFLSPLKSLDVFGLPNMSYFPVERFRHITKLIIRSCDHIKIIKEKDFCLLPLRYLEIIHCKNLMSFPYQQLTSFTSLEELVISHCPQMDNTFPCGSWPPNLRILTIGGLNKSMSEWGTQNFPTSLVTLYLHGQNSGAVPFAEAENNKVSNFLLPSTLTFLEINGFVNLKSLSKGLQHLTRLEGLVIDACPKLVDLPEKLLSQLLSLKVYYCLKLQQKCHSKKGNYRHILSQIPDLYV